MHAISLPLMLHATSAALAMIAVTAIGLALHGRRVNDHLICRRCGFDLFGKPESSKACAECGASLDKPRAMRIGRRETRRSVLWLAVLIFLTCLAWEGRCGWAAAKAIDWNQHKPAWWLVREAHDKYVPTRDAALAELARRISVGTLPREREAALIDEALALQADLNRPWIAGWGTLVETARDAKRLSDKRWEFYLLQGFQLTLAPARPICRPCDPLRFTVRHGPDRIGAMKETPEGFKVGIYVPGDYGDERILIGGKLAKNADIEGTSNDPYSMPRFPAARPLAYEMDIAPGGTVGGALEIHISAAWPDGQDALAEGPQTAQLTLIVKPIVHDWPWYIGKTDICEDSRVPPRKLNLSCSFVCARRPAVNVDESLSSAVERALSVDYIQFCEENVYMGHLWQLKGQLTCHHAPIDLAYRVVFHVPGGDQHFSADENLHYVKQGGDARLAIYTHHYLSPKDFPSQTVDIELMPEPSASPIGALEIWGRPIFFKGIPVRGREGWKPAPPIANERYPIPVVVN